jgi:hypothetical protein
MAGGREVAKDAALGVFFLKSDLALFPWSCAPADFAGPDIQAQEK